MQIKQFKGNKECVLQDFKAIENPDGSLKISGYANTKHVADRYGDIPTEFNRGYVYDINEFLKNPIMLVGHCSSIDHVAGSFTKIQEDERGLYVEGVISNSDHPLIKHLRTIVKEGHVKTFSIGGMWLFEDLENPDHLTLAKIYEISIVAIPADPNATFEPNKKAGEKEEGPAEPVEPKLSEPKELDFSPLNQKLTVFEMNQKLNKFEVNIKQPVQGQGANK